MFCWNCGKSVEDNHLFCVSCGARVRTIGTPPVQRMIPPQQSSPVQPMQQMTDQMYQDQPVWQMQQIDPRWQAQALGQKGTFKVKILPIIMIVLMTIGLFISSMFAGSGSMAMALLLSAIAGLVLLVFVYKTDRVEPEPLPLLIKLFLCGAILVPFWVSIVEGLLGYVIALVFGDYPVIYSVMEAFIVAATVEELGKYAALKFGSWKHPAFNFRFDGIVYAATVALGFEIVENLLYILQYGFGTALIRTAFPGHLVFSIYMGYYYGLAKSYEVMGDKIRSKRARRKAIIIPLIIHGIYDTICFWSELSDSTLYVLGSFAVLLIIMLVLNVTAYINIKKYAFEDQHV